MPPPSVWGPLLWKVLHGLVIGGIPSLQRDSERECIWILNHLEYILPCKECAEHLVRFRQKYPVPKSYTTIGEWICNLHNSVNEKLGKEVVPYEQRTATDVGDWRLFLDSVKDSILLGLIQGDKLREFSRHFLLWLQYSK